MKSHPWFREIDWERLYERREKGPFIPKLRGKDDASCFDDYDPPEEGGKKEEYTEEMRNHYEEDFKDF